MWHSKGSFFIYLQFKAYICITSGLIVPVLTILPGKLLSVQPPTASGYPRWCPRGRWGCPDRRIRTCSRWRYWRRKKTLSTLKRPRRSVSLPRPTRSCGWRRRCLDLRRQNLQLSGFRMVSGFRMNQSTSIKYTTIKFQKPLKRFALKL